MRIARSLAILVLLGAAACSSASSAPTTDPLFTSPPARAETDDPPPPASEAGTDPPVEKPDAGPDAKPVDDDGILGTLSGSCGIVKTQLALPTPSITMNGLVFVTGESFTKASLSPGGQTLFDVPNAGGSSFESEAMSFEVLRACEGASLLKTETEVQYEAGAGAITDILVEIGGQKVGVSVTRAYKPSNLSYPDADVKALLEKKLDGILQSSARVLAGDKWVKQILHVFTANQATTDAVLRVYPTIDAVKRADTIVLVTRTTGGGFIYCNPDPPLGAECP